MTFSTNSLRQKSHSQANEFVMKITQDNHHHYHSLHTIAARITQTIKSNKNLHYMQTTLLTTIKIFHFFTKLFHTARLILAAEMWLQHRMLLNEINIQVLAICSANAHQLLQTVAGT